MQSTRPDSSFPSVSRASPFARWIAHTNAHDLPTRAPRADAVATLGRRRVSVSCFPRPGCGWSSRFVWRDWSTPLGIKAEAAFLESAFIYNAAMRDQMLPRKPLPLPELDQIPTPHVRDAADLDGRHHGSRQLQIQRVHFFIADIPHQQRRPVRRHPRPRPERTVISPDLRRAGNCL